MNENINIRYFVSEEKKVVVCKLESCFDDLFYDMSNKGYCPHPLMEIKDTFVGKAKCSVDDVFDIEKGKKIAYNRAVAKLNISKQKALCKFMKEMNVFHAELVNNANRLSSKYDSAIARNQREIDTVINSTEE